MVVLHAGSVFAQTVMVAMPAGAMEESVLGDRRTPVLVIMVLGLVTVQVVLVYVWRLVTMAQRGTVFSPAAFRDVHLVVDAFVVFALLVFALGVVLESCEVVPPSLWPCWAGHAWRPSGSRSSCSCCGYCWHRPSHATSRRRNSGPSWPR
jgi:hypothetical protein